MNSPEKRFSSFSEIDDSQQLPLALSLYLRKLVRQNLDRLALIEATSQDALDPNSLFDRLCQPGWLTESNIHELESLVDRHQTGLQQGGKGRRLLQQTEQEIFTRLGLRLTRTLAGETVLIVDDTPGNLRLLSSALTQQGYEVRNAINGSLALSGAKTIRPDLILLDIMMPGMDGYEVCRRLKEDPQSRDIPVIFISAIDGVMDKVKAFEVGGVDYVSKPFQIEEVLARIEHQLQISNLQSRLEEQNLRLQQDASNRQSLERYAQTLWDSSRDGLYRIAADGTLQAVNQAFADIMGYDRPQYLITKNTADFYVQPVRWHEFVAQIQQSGQVIDFEAEVRQRDGTVISITATAQALTDPMGQVMSYEGRIQEIVDKAATTEREGSRRRIRQLLMSLFPKAIAKRFVHDSKNRFAEGFPQATLLVMMVEDMLFDMQSPEGVIDRYNQVMQILETTAKRHEIEYIRPLGQMFLAATGLPTPRADHADRMVRYALDLKHQGLSLRMGLHSGEVIAGIVGGEQQLSYELYGETLEIAQQLIQQGQPSQILLSTTTRNMLSDSYGVQASAVGPIESYWLA
jgi:adenylate cyclase